MSNFNNKMDSVKPKLLRVTQMNAVYFDKELQNVFSQHIQDCMKFLPPIIAAKFEHEIYLLLRLSILHYSIMKHNSSFGQKLLSIQYKNLTSTKKYLILLASCFEYARNRLEPYKSAAAINRMMTKISNLSNILTFLNISIFLRNGSKPLLMERLLCLDQVYTNDNIQRQFETKYMTREILWNGFIEILVYILPLINYQKITRTIRNINPLHTKPKSTLEINRDFTTSSTCPYCKLSPVLPHHMGCAHVFCYSCLKGNQLADSKYECPDCEYSRETSNICEKVSVL